MLRNNRQLPPVSADRMLVVVILGVFAMLGLIWLITFPIRLVLRIAFALTFGLVRGVLHLLFAPILLIFLVVAIVVAFVAAVVAMLAPLIPIAIVGLIVWGIYRLTSNRSAATV